MRTSNCRALGLVTVLALIAGCAAPPEETPATDEALVGSTQTFGIFYSTLHCASRNPVYDISRVLAREATWGPVNAGHWWGQPDRGYYCLSEDDATLRAHAELIRDAGIQFVFVDITNHPDMTSDLVGSPPQHSRSDRPELMIKGPLERMLAVWSDVPNAPKVVPWVQMVEDGERNIAKGDMIDYVADKIIGHKLAFLAGGNPAVLVAPSAAGYATKKMAAYANKLTLQKMWADVNSEPSDAWSFMSRCRDGFTSGPNSDEAFRRDQGKTKRCGQLKSGDGLQISVTAAYQHNYMSNTSGPDIPAMPKFYGRTLLRQLQTAGASDAPFVTITGWNEWTSGRLANGHFTDEYNREYNRDLEPGGGMGDLYYQLLKRGIAALRAGSDPMTVLGTPGAIRGFIDGFDGKALRGWACAAGTPTPITVHVFAGGPAGQGTILGGFAAEAASEPAVAKACDSFGTVYRFRIPLSPEVLSAHRGKPIYVHGIHPTGSHPNDLLTQSGTFTVPPP